MAKPLRDITKHGVNSSKEVENDLTNLAMSPEGNKGEIEFAKKHKISRKDDVAGNGDEVYKGSNIKVAKYDRQDAKVYEETEDLDEKYMGFQKTKKALAAKGAKSPSALAAWIGRKKYGKEKFQAAAAKGKKLGEAAGCNHTNEGVYCEMHGKAACPSDDKMSKDEKKKGEKLLLDKKRMDEGIRPMTRKDTSYKDNPKKLSNEYPKSFRQPGTPSKSELRASGEKAMASSKITKLPPGKAKGLKEESLDEVAPPNAKIEKWINSNKERFVKQYGKEKGMQVLYAKAWKMHGQSESGAATNTDYVGPGAAGWSTGRLDVGTL